MVLLPPRTRSGQSLVELLITLALTAILLPALLTGLITSRQGRPQTSQRLSATALMRETVEAIRSVRSGGWSGVSTNGTYHPEISGSHWSLVSGSDIVSGYTRSIIIADVSRNSSGVIVTSGGTLDPSTKLVTVNLSWSLPYNSSISTQVFLTRYMDNLTYIQTTEADFNRGVVSNMLVTNTSGGELQLAQNNRARWCSPALSTATIDLPDGPPVAVSAFADPADSSNPNQVFAATAPNDSTQVKLAYVAVTANTDPPVPTLKGTFTLDPALYSSPSYVPTNIGLDNNFKTNDVKYYKSVSGKMYALLATDRPDKEVVVVQINNGTSDAFQDPINKIYKYWTFFNTRQYQGDNRSTPNQDQTPFGYGAVAITIFGSRGYLASGGFLYVFDLSNIDSKTTGSGLDEVGCRIQLDGYDCKPGSGTDEKYNSGQTGTSWGNTTSPVHNDCSDGGNIELYANHQLSVTQVSSNTYVYVAVGAGTNPEFNLVNATSVPTNSSSPKINSNSCGTISTGNSGWKRISSLDFNPNSGTEEAANSVFASPDGSRAYISSNGGIDPHNHGIPDSDQFYILDTSNKNSPKFLSTWSSGTWTANTAKTGYYNGDATNIQLFPRRSLTVLNGQRAILVGQDGYPQDGVEPHEYQVLNIENESSPGYCGGINYLPGFNDLTSVSEADGDNFVYMVANTSDKELKIIQGGPDGRYMASGYYESAIFDPGYPTAFNRFSASVLQPGSTTIRAQVAVANAVSNSCLSASYNFIGPDGTAGSFFNAVAASVSATIPFGDYQTSYHNPGRCLKLKVYMDTTDYDATPTLYDLNVNYSP